MRSVGVARRMRGHWSLSGGREGGRMWRISKLKLVLGVGIRNVKEYCNGILLVRILMTL